MSIQYRINTLKATESVLKSKATIDESKVGKYMVLTVRGNGNIIDVKNKAGELVSSAGHKDVILRKKIFNTKCNSDIAFRNPMNKDMLKKAYRFETAGNNEAAAELYNKYLNSIEVSVSLLEGSKLFHAIQDGDQIKGQVEMITTEKGSILTLNPKTISIMPPEVATAKDLDLSFAMEDGDDEDAIAQGAETITMEELSEVAL